MVSNFKLYSSQTLENGSRGVVEDQLMGMVESRRSHTCLRI
jgi:hypothetical protein